VNLYRVLGDSIATRRPNSQHPKQFHYNARDIHHLPCSAPSVPFTTILLFFAGTVAVVPNYKKQVPELWEQEMAKHSCAGWGAELGKEDVG